jgi:transposase
MTVEEGNMIDEFLKVQQDLPRGGHRWWWNEADLSAEQRDAVVQALGRPDVSDKAVQIVLGNWGVKVSRQQVGHLRRKLNDE